jgi:hypothetical protein
MWRGQALGRAGGQRARWQSMPTVCGATCLSQVHPKPLGPTLMSRMDTCGTRLRVVSLLKSMTCAEGPQGGAMGVAGRDEGAPLILHSQLRRVAICVRGLRLGGTPACQGQPAWPAEIRPAMTFPAQPPPHPMRLPLAPAPP